MRIGMKQPRSLQSHGQRLIIRNHSYAFGLINDQSRSKVTDSFSIALPLKDEMSTTSFGAWGWSVIANTKQRDLALNVDRLSGKQKKVET